MTTGETSPWARGASPVPPPADPVSYDGPWQAGPPRPAPLPSPPAPGWTTAPPWTGAPVVSDELLRRLPPPGASAPRPPLQPGEQDQRPATIGLAATLAVTASLLWVCGLSLFLLVAAAGTRALGPSGDDGVVFHLLDEAVLRMGDGLWVPLYGFPLASTVTGFCLLARRPWARVAHTVAGAAALAWAGWWLRESLLMWFVVAVYVVVAVAVLWVPSVGRWYAGRPRRAPEGFALSG